MKKTMPVFLLVGLIVLLAGLISAGGEKGGEKNSVEVRATVLEADNSNMVQSGLTKIGAQRLLIEIAEGRFKGQRVQAANTLLGQMEFDTYYKPGDKIIAALLLDNNQIKAARAVELYRQNWQLVLFGLFVICLIAYAGLVGLKALFSFVASIFIVWTVLIPGLLKGNNPLLLSGLVLLMLTAVIIFSVAGFTKTGLAAFIGTICGLLVTIAVTIIFGDKMFLSGMSSPYAATLLFSGHINLNIQQIFYAAIIIGASGAAMDIAMDVAAAMAEIKANCPEIEGRELIRSGLNVGRAVIGTMTTTLLLAYSGGYLTLLMLFMTKDTSFVRIINMQIVAAEIMRTVAGSIGLVLVAPITAVAGGWILCAKSCSGGNLERPGTGVKDSN